MVMPKYTPRGGFKRKFRIGEFIRDSLAGGKIAYGEELHRLYKEAVQLVSYTDPRKMGHRRRCINYAGFQIYLSCARRLGLLEYCNPDGSSPGGSLVTEPAKYPQLSGRRYLRLTPGAEGSPYWTDLQGYAKGMPNNNPSSQATP